MRELITTRQAAQLVAAADPDTDAENARKIIQKFCNQIPGAVKPGREWWLDKDSFLEWWANRPCPGRRWPPDHERKWPKRKSKRKDRKP